MSNLVGQSLGRYQILEQLGEGGMAAVYKAYDTRLERQVAIKVIRMEQFAPGELDQAMKRFDREAKALAQLSHPNIVPVYDYGEFQGSPYLVMEFLPGGTLKRRLDAPLPWQEALRILLPVAHAMAYAHAHNIIHRDIKPANILLTESGWPMLSDFGIAKILESKAGATLTAAGMGIGTPEYMAPEQWKGQTGVQTDIYSFGVVLYELVSGRKPYIADTPIAIMLKQINDPLPPPSQFVLGLPEGLENAIFKALARQPQDRYQSMDEFAAALERLLSSGQTLPAGAQASADQSDRTWYAASGSRPEGGPAPVSVAAGSRPTPGQIPEIPMPPAAPPRTSIRWGLWIPVAVLLLLLCGGAVVGGGLLIRGLSPVPPARQASPTAPATPTNPPSQVIPPSQTNTPVQGNPPPATNPPAAPPTLVPTAVPTAFKVLWDVSHGPRTSSEGGTYTPEGLYKPLVQVLSSQKFVVSSGDLGNLDSYDILVFAATSATQTVYSTLEADKIEKFVRASGHGLLILSDIPGFGNLADNVGRRFSIGFGEVTSDSPTSLSNEPFFSGVSSIEFLFGGGAFQVGTPSQVAATDKDGNSVIAFCECDAGRVMAIGDSNLWDNRGLGQADNQRFAVNVFRWLAKLAP